MDKYIDLTHTIRDNLPVFPGDTGTLLRHTKFLCTDHHNNYNLQISMHSGTHIDGPMHLTESKTRISQISLDHFIGDGCIIDANGEAIIRLKDEYKQKVKTGDIVLIYTGHDRNFEGPEYFSNYPVIDYAFAEYLAEKKVKMLGMDTPSPDKVPFEVHKLLFRNNILVLENLTNLDKLLTAGRFEVIALPVRIEADSAIARVVARVESK